MKKLFFFTAFAVLAVVLFVSAKCNDKPEAGDGWIVLFDGTSFDDWRGYDRADIPSLWTIEGGAMKIQGSGGNEGSDGGGDIMYDRKFREFEFELEWKVEGPGNSGIMYLAREIPGEPMYISAPEYQILSNRPGDISASNSGSLYDMIAADPQNVNPIGEWNKARIVVRGGKVEHWQNGVKVVEYRPWTPEWERMVDGSKFGREKWPLAYEMLTDLGGAEREGYIGLQDHGHGVWFRNIRIREF